MPDPKLIALHPRLFVRGHTRHLATGDVLRLVQERNIRMIVNVALIPDKYLDVAARNIGLMYKHVPLHDSKNIPVDTITKLADEVAHVMGFAGVLVHCDSGWNRSNLVALLALAKHTGKPIVDLIAMARMGRPKTLKNMSFEKFVLEHGAQYERKDARDEQTGSR